MRKQEFSGKQGWRGTRRADYETLTRLNGQIKNSDLNSREMGSHWLHKSIFSFEIIFCFVLFFGGEARDDGFGTQFRKARGSSESRVSMFLEACR